MERGELGIENRYATLFVFEELIAHLERPRVEALYRKAGRWKQALDCWNFNQSVCDYIYALMSRYDVPVDVVTWRPQEFADVLHNKLWERRVPVRTTMTADYRSLSPWVATDPDVSVVYDPDPNHRFGYGFKAREFSLERF